MAFVMAVSAKNLTNPTKLRSKKRAKSGKEVAVMRTQMISLILTIISATATTEILRIIERVRSKRNKKVISVTVLPITLSASMIQKIIATQIIGLQTRKISVKEATKVRNNQRVRRL